MWEIITLWQMYQTELNQTNNDVLLISFRFFNFAKAFRLIRWDLIQTGMKMGKEDF